MPLWTLKLFDRFELRHDDQVRASLGSRKEELLLAFVALNAERALPRDEICATLWPGRELPRSRRNFSYSLSVLRKRLAELGKPDCLYVGARSVQLNPTVTTDRARFEELLAAALRGGGAQRRDLLERALALYGEGLLPGIDEPWVEGERARLARLATAARRSLAELMADEGALAGVTADLRGAAFGAGGVGAAGGAGGVGAGSDARGARAHGVDGLQASGADGLLAAEDVETKRRRRRRTKRDDAPDKILAWAETMADPLNGPDRLNALDAVAVRWPAVEAALVHFRTKREHRKGGRLVAALWRYWYHRARPEDGRLHAEAFLAFGDWPPGVQRARLLHAAGTLAHKADDNASAYRRLRLAVQAWADVDDDAGLLGSLANLAMVAYDMDDGEETDAEANARYETALRIAERLDDDYHRTTLLLGAAQLAIRQAKREQALELLARRRVVVERTSDRAAEASTWSHIASARLLEPVDLAGASEAIERARVLYHEVGDVVGECYAMRLLGYAAEQRGEGSEAGEEGEAGEKGQAGETGEAGEKGEAERWYRAALELARETADAGCVAAAMGSLAELYEAQGRDDEAAAMRAGATAG